MHDETHVLQVVDTRFRMPKPEALRMAAHQRRGPLAKRWRSGRGRRHFAQFIGLGNHERKLATPRSRGKESFQLQPARPPSPS